ncbi:hypothetical protein ACSCBZ_18160 [Streptomyces niveiscabiei]|uniref:Uncharacterized protein n=1 Tax=Streptomyces niveiscabiei TaxID=164115 RepID=A0ABW9HH34_9ACTN|nr:MULTISPECIES: hypothetical protein [Streptomyces]
MSPQGRGGGLTRVRRVVADRIDHVPLALRDRPPVRQLPSTSTSGERGDAFGGDLAAMPRWPRTGGARRKLLGNSPRTTAQ